MPLIEVVTEVVPIPAELVEIQPIPEVPEQGTNGDLLIWAQQCGATLYYYEDVLTRLKELK